MKIRTEVADQLLLCKSLLEKIRIQAVPDPDRFSLAIHILTAHDAAELALAAIAQQCGVSPASDKAYMMDYFAALKTLHSDREVKGRPYFNQLNRVRVDLKHYGIIPHTTDWARVADKVYNYIFDLCAEYLNISLDDLDESILLTSTTVKAWYDQARAAMAEGKYKAVLEYLSQALFCLFRESAGLRRLSIGRADATDAIKLTGFGVHAKDYLALQEFLPEVKEENDGTITVKWRQRQFGHPGNWREDAASFCIRTFLDVALKIQPAQWTPGADQIEQLDELITAEGDGTQFFEKTYITQGMQDLISEGMARLAGVSTQGIFHLKQAMGGGKTHLLVGFGLLAKHPELRQQYCAGIPHAQAFEVADIAAFNGRNNPDHFFWGEIANQLGKGEQFKTFWTSGPKAPDEKDWLKLFDGGKPILILLDEMPPYFHYLDTQKVGNGTVADIATRAFANLHHGRRQEDVTSASSSPTSPPPTTPAPG